MGTKGLILAAGYGTRFLPVTRVVPKELLPIVARPALALVVDELAQAGVTDLLVVTSRRKQAVEAWFDRDPELEALPGMTPARLAVPDVRVQFVRQRRMGGTGDAIRLARAFAGDDPLVVAFPDDLFGDPNPTAALLRAHAATGAAVLGALDLSGQDVSAYGVIDGAPLPHDADLWQVRRVVEKPAAGTEPSHLVSVGRYLYTPELLDALDRHAARATPGEYHPMPAMEELAGNGRLMARVLGAPRWDTGTPAGYLRCVLDHALADPDLGPDLSRWLHDRLGGPSRIV